MSTPCRLFLVESPNKTAKIEAMYPDVRCLATVGHICDLPANPKEGIGIDRATMRGQYALTKDSSRRTDGARVVARLKKFLADHPGIDVYLATDPDREGESIAAFAAKYLELKNPKRITYNAMKKEAIDRALDAVGEIDWPAVASREARRLIDRIIGYTVSPLLSRLIGQRAAAGRVQTAIEALIVERERKIRGHRSQTGYNVRHDLGGWFADWQPPLPARRTAPGPRANAEYDIEPTARCLDEVLANDAAAQKALQVVSVSDVTEDRLPPPPLHTVGMLQVADRMLNWEPDKTMRVAQKLFEGGHITYHRTDSPNLSPEAAESIRTWLVDHGFEVPAKPNQWPVRNTQAQEGHEAIQPAHLDVETAGEDSDEQALYRIIRERALYSQLPPARYAVRTIALTDPGRGSHTYRATTRALQSPGWLATPAAKNPILADASDEDDKDKETRSTPLPDLARGALIQSRGATVDRYQTKAPPRYTLNTLNAKLEKLGIGRPATIASLLKSVQTKGAVKLRKDRSLEALPLAEQTYDILYPRFAFAHIGYTAELEAALDLVARQKLDGVALTRKVWDQLDHDCAALDADKSLAAPSPAGTSPHH